MIALPIQEHRVITRKGFLQVFDYGSLYLGLNGFSKQSRKGPIANIHFWQHLAHNKDGFGHGYTNAII